jgi:hypothetical protein
MRCEADIGRRSAWRPPPGSNGIEEAIAAGEITHDIGGRLGA